MYDNILCRQYLWWVVVWEHKTELFWYLSGIEGTDVFVIWISGNIWGSEYELIGALLDKI